VREASHASALQGDSTSYKQVDAKPEIGFRATGTLKNGESIAHGNTDHTAAPNGHPVH